MRRTRRKTGLNKSQFKKLLKFTDFRNRKEEVFDDPNFIKDIAEVSFTWSNICSMKNGEEITLIEPQQYNSIDVYVHKKCKGKSAIGTLLKMGDDNDGEGWFYKMKKSGINLAVTGGGHEWLKLDNIPKLIKTLNKYSKKELDPNYFN